MNHCDSCFLCITLWILDLYFQLNYANFKVSFVVIDKIGRLSKRLICIGTFEKENNNCLFCKHLGILLEFHNLFEHFRSLVFFVILIVNWNNIFRIVWLLFLWNKPCNAKLIVELMIIFWNSCRQFCSPPTNGGFEPKILDIYYIWLVHEFWTEYLFPTNPQNSCPTLRLLALIKG